MAVSVAPDPRGALGLAGRIAYHDDCARHCPTAWNREGVAGCRRWRWTAPCYRLYRVRIRTSPLSPEALDESHDQRCRCRCAIRICDRSKSCRGTAEHNACRRRIRCADGLVRGTAPCASSKGRRLSFRLATLTGPPRGGTDRVSRPRATTTRLNSTIESWARSGDRLSDVMYSAPSPRKGGATAHVDVGARARRPDRRGSPSWSDRRAHAAASTSTPYRRR